MCNKLAQVDAALARNSNTSPVICGQEVDGLKERWSHLNLYEVTPSV
jgi:hypothetical protein